MKAKWTKKNRYFSRSYYKLFWKHTNLKKRKEKEIRTGREEKKNLCRKTMFAYTLEHGEGEQRDKPQWIWHHQGPNALWSRDLRSVGIHHVLTGVHHCVTGILERGADGAVNSCTNRKSLCRNGAQRWKSAIPMPRGLKQHPEVILAVAKEPWPQPVTTTARQTETMTGLSSHFKLETQIWQTSCYLPIFASREAMACWSAPANTSLSWLVIGTHSVCTRIRRSPANSTVWLSIDFSWTKKTKKLQHTDNFFQFKKGDAKTNTPHQEKRRKKTHRRLLIIQLMDHSGN